jgi:hypothetical protein
MCDCVIFLVLENNVDLNVKVLFAGLAILTVWLITATRRNRNKIAYLRNQVAQVKKILIKLENNERQTKTETRRRGGKT